MMDVFVQCTKANNNTPFKTPNKVVSCYMNVFDWSDAPEPLVRVPYEVCRQVPNTTTIYDPRQYISHITNQIGYDYLYKICTGEDQRESKIENINRVCPSAIVTFFNVMILFIKECGLKLTIIKEKGYILPFGYIKPPAPRKNETKTFKQRMKELWIPLSASGKKDAPSSTAPFSELL